MILDKYYIWLTPNFWQVDRANVNLKNVDLNCNLVEVCRLATESDPRSQGRVKEKPLGTKLLFRRLEDWNRHR